MMLQPEINHLVPSKINKKCLTLLKIILVCVCCVSLSLLIEILLVSNAWDICPGPVLLWQPPQAFSWPEPTSLVWPLWILWSLQYALQQKPSENFKEQDYYSQVLESPQHASGPHCEVMGWERGERKRTWRESGALPLIGSKVGVLRVLQVHSVQEEIFPSTL